MRPSRRFGGVFISLWLGMAPVAATEALMDEDVDQSPNPLMSEGYARHLRNPVNDLRVGAILANTPKITEEVDSSGTTSSIEWKHRRPTGGGAELSYLVQAWPHRRWGGLLIGGEVQYLYFNITPSAYGIGGASTTNLGHQALKLQEANAALLLGWGTPPVYTRWGEWDVEALAVGGAGLLWADTQSSPPAGTNPPFQKSRGFGWSWSGGPRLGVYLAEACWVMGLHVDWVYTHGRANINLATGGHSRLTDRNNGPAGTVEAGYRF